MDLYLESLHKLDYWTQNVLDIIWEELVLESKHNSYNIYIKNKRERERNEFCISLSIKYLMERN